MGRASTYAYLLILLGCGGQSEKTLSRDTARDRPQLEAACADLAAAMCARRDECEAPTTRNARYATAADCRARTELACADWTTLPGTGATVDTLTTCAATVSGASCRDVTTLFHSWDTDLPYCLPAGTFADGSVCVTDAQCESRTCKPASEGCGTCASTAGDLPAAYEGDACDQAAPLCASFLECTSAGTCARLECEPAGCLDYGHHCTGIGNPAPNDCPLGTECTGMSDLGRGTCLAYVPEGTECNAYSGPPCLYPARCVEKRCRLPSEIECR